MSGLEICGFCGRPVRRGANAYRVDAAVFHFECTDPPPVMNIAQLKFKRGDALAVLIEQHLSQEQRERISNYIKFRTGAKVIVIDGGAGLAVLSDHDTPHAADPTTTGATSNV
jgi:hypothetical protein